MWSCVALLLVIGVAGWAIGERMATSIIRQKLQDLVAENLHARLEIGELRYDYPYGVRVEGASLITTTESGEPGITLVSFRSLSLQLSEIPLGDGPLQIEQIILDQPTVHLVRTEQGFGGDRPLLREDRPGRNAQTDRPKLSDLFRLRHLRCDNARIEYDDRRSPGVPLVWDQLNVRVDSTPSRHFTAFYFTFSAVTPHANISTGGMLDLNEMLLAVTRMRVDAKVEHNQPSTALPQPVQKLLDDLHLAGNATLEVDYAAVPLTSVGDRRVSGSLTVTVRDARAKVPGWPWLVDNLNAQISVSLLPDGQLLGETGNIYLQSAGSGLSIQPIERFMVDLHNARWQCTPLGMALTYVPVEPESKPAVLRQPITLSIRAALRQLESGANGEARLDGTVAKFPAGRQLEFGGATLSYRAGRLHLGPSSIKGLGGRMECGGEYDTQQHTANAWLALSGIDLAQLMAVLDPAGDRQHKGIITGHINASFTDASFRTLQGEGRFHIDDGEFAKVPVLGQIVEELKIGRDLFVAKSADGRFKLGDQQVTFDRIAVHTSALQICGTGTMGFDKCLNFSVYADAAANWEKDIKQAKIPLLSDVAGLLAGGTQKVIGAVSKELTHLRVTGTIDQPQVMPQPVPGITKNLARLFGSEEE